MNQIISTNDFNKKLLEAFCEEEEDDENVCLISGEKLHDNHIKLICGHKFNYKSIYCEIINQKKYSNLETQNLKKYQIKCPYCRNVQNGVLPLYDNSVKVNGVNWPPAKVAKNNKCSVILKSGKRKGEKCGRACFGEKCTFHNKSKKVAADAITCIAIVKSGKRKGLICGCMCKTPETKQLKMCKRHSKNVNSTCI